MTAGRLQLVEGLSPSTGAQKVRYARISQALARPRASSRLAREVCLGVFEGLESGVEVGGGEKRGGGGGGWSSGA